VLVTKAHTDLSWMFANCVKLTKINSMNEWDTSNVDRMIAMFYKCESLTSLDLSSFNTSKVNYMQDVFSGCSNLTTINGISNFDTSNVNFISGMFYNCSKLTELDLSSWNFDNVTNMLSMFYGCSSLTSLNMSNCDVSNVTSMTVMLDGCSSLVDFQAPKNISADLNLSTCTLLSHDSLMSIINNLTTVTGKTLDLGATNLAKLTDEEKAIATNKGWTLE
jgi:surface protein